MIAAGLGAGACAPRPPLAAPPIKTLTRYREALEHDDPKAAYALMTNAAQQALPYDQFAQQWQETQAERAAQAAELHQLLQRDRDPSRRPKSGEPAKPGGPVHSGGSTRSGRPGPPLGSAPSAPDLASTAPGLRVRAVVTLPQGAQLVLAPVSAERFLADRSSAWRVLDPDLQVIRAQTPEAALRLLIAAAEQRNYPALLRLLTKSERQSLEAELSERLERLRSTLSRGQPIETTGERARIQYDPRFFIDLKREQDGWRISDFN